MEISQQDDRQTAADAVAGILAASAIFVSLIALAHKPVRIAPFAIVVSLIAIAMSKRNEKLGLAALVISGACFVLGTIFAVITNHPLF
jgi:hypothetical protein